MKNALIFIIFILFSCKGKETTQVQRENKIKAEVTLKEKSVESNQKKAIETKSFRAISQENLAYREVLSGVLKIKVPASFSLMSERMVRLKYPTANPKLIEVYSNEEATVNLLLNLSEKPLKKEEISNILNSVVQRYKSVPYVSVEQSEIIKVKDKDIAIIGFNSEAIDVNIYNLMFITNIRGKTFTANYNCTFDNATEWKDKGIDIVNSIIEL